MIVKLSVKNHTSKRKMQIVKTKDSSTLSIFNEPIL